MKVSLGLKAGQRVHNADLTTGAGDAKLCAWAQGMQLHHLELDTQK